MRRQLFHEHMEIMSNAFMGCCCSQALRRRRRRLQPPNDVHIELIELYAPISRVLSAATMFDTQTNALATRVTQREEAVLLAGSALDWRAVCRAVAEKGYHALAVWPSSSRGQEGPWQTADPAVAAALGQVMHVVHQQLQCHICTKENDMRMGDFAVGIQKGLLMVNWAELHDAKLWAELHGARAHAAHVQASHIIVHGARTTPATPSGLCGTTPPR